MVSSALSSHRWDTRDLVLFALFTALIAIGAFIRIPVPFCPFTLQLLFTTLAGLLLGSRRGAAADGAGGGAGDHDPPGDVRHHR